MVFVISLTQHRNASTSRSLLPSPRRCAGMVRQTSPRTLPWLLATVVVDAEQRRLIASLDQALHGLRAGLAQGCLGDRKVRQPQELVAQRVALRLAVPPHE